MSIEAGLFPAEANDIVPSSKSFSSSFIRSNAGMMSDSLKVSGKVEIIGSRRNGFFKSSAIDASRGITISATLEVCVISSNLAVSASIISENA